MSLLDATSTGLKSVTHSKNSCLGRVAATADCWTGNGGNGGGTVNLIGRAAFFLDSFSFSAYFVLSDALVVMTSVLSSVEKCNPAVGSPRRPAYLDLTRTEYREFVDLTYPSSKCRLLSTPG
jgi:hypothetical protein